MSDKQGRRQEERTLGGERLGSCRVPFVVVISWIQVRPRRDTDGRVDVLPIRAPGDVGSAAVLAIGRPAGVPMNDKPRIPERLCTRTS